MRIPKTKEGIVLLHGENLFQPMINFINLLCRKDGKLKPSKYLNIEISNYQIQNLNLAKQYLRRSKKFQDSMQKSSRKLATRKLNVIGNMVVHCSVLTSEENIKRDTEDMQLAETYEDIKESHKQSKSLKRDR